MAELASGKFEVGARQPADRELAAEPPGFDFSGFELTEEEAIEDARRAVKAKRSRHDRAMT